MNSFEFLHKKGGIERNSNKFVQKMSGSIEIEVNNY